MSLDGAAPGATVLAVGVRADGEDAEPLILAAGAAGAAGVVFRGDVSPGARAAALETGVDLRVLDAAATWESVWTPPPLSDSLSDLADALAALLATAVAIEDAGGRVRARSGPGSSRRGRTVPVECEGRHVGIVVVSDMSLPPEADALLDAAARRAAACLVDLEPLHEAENEPVGAYLDRVVMRMRDRPELASPRVDALFESDRAHGTSFAATLDTHLRCMGSAAEAAEVLHLNRKSIRYRLRRVMEISGLDLSDPLERLAARVQLRSRR